MDVAHKRCTLAQFDCRDSGLTAQSCPKLPIAANMLYVKKKMTLDVVRASCAWSLSGFLGWSWVFGGYPVRVNARHGQRWLTRTRPDLKAQHSLSLTGHLIQQGLSRGIHHPVCLQSKIQLESRDLIQGRAVENAPGFYRIPQLLKHLLHL